MTNAQCDQCVFWDNRGIDQDQIHGRCRRRAPSAKIEGLDYQLSMWSSALEKVIEKLPERWFGDVVLPDFSGAMDTIVWPRTFNTDWCGEYRERAASSQQGEVTEQMSADQAGYPHT